MEKYTKDPKAKEQLKKMKERAPLYEKHEFWDKMPVPHLAHAAKAPAEGEIEKKTVKEVRPTVLALPEGFEWSEIDISKEPEAEEVILCSLHLKRYLRY